MAGKCTLEGRDGSKACRKCGATKPLTEFYRARGNTFAPDCIPCMRKAKGLSAEPRWRMSTLDLARNDGRRTCPRCATPKPLTEYQASDPLHAACLACQRIERKKNRAAIRARSMRYCERHAEELHAKARDRNVRNRATRRAWETTEALEKPLKRQAQGIATYAISTGRLVPGPCEVGIDCFGSTQGHHDDYAKPLEVRWLCRRHHQQWHAANGEGLNAELPKVEKKR